jgi:hypothetical protein
VEGPVWHAQHTVHLVWYQILTVKNNFMLGWPCKMNFMCVYIYIYIYIYIITNSMHCLSLFYRIITPLHVSDVSLAHYQEVECICVANGTCYTSKLTVSRPGWNGMSFLSAQAWWQLTQKYNKYHLPHIYILPPDDGLLIHPKCIEVWYLIKLRINSA